MTYDCYCDGDVPVAYRSTIRRARKQYLCEECGGRIAVGERYEDVWGVMSDSDPYIVKTCERCVDLRIWVKNNVPCFCWAHGNLDDDMARAIDDAYWRARDEVCGLNFGFLRRKILRDRHNKLARAA